jgi:hypothetical protein
VHVIDQPQSATASLLATQRTYYNERADDYGDHRSRRTEKAEV